MNGFLELAKRQLAPRTKTRHQSAERVRRRHHNGTRSSRDCDHQLRNWDQWRRGCLEAVLAGPHGRSLQELIPFLETMTIHDAPALVALVKVGRWQRTDPNTRLEVLGVIDDHIIKLREAHGLAPFDDGLTDDDLTAFQQIREMLR
jgi:hypothetical protein